MIGRCDDGHIHPANTEDHACLRALDAVTPSDDIVKVPARYFLPQVAMPQEVLDSAMLTRVRFDCPLKSTEVLEDSKLGDLRVVQLEQKITRLEFSIQDLLYDRERLVILEESTEEKMAMFQKKLSVLTSAVQELQTKAPPKKVPEDEPKATVAPASNRKLADDKCDKKPPKLDEKLGKCEKHSNSELNFLKRIQEVEAFIEEKSLAKEFKNDSKMEKKPNSMSVLRRWLLLHPLPQPQ